MDSENKNLTSLNISGIHCLKKYKLPTVNDNVKCLVLFGCHSAWNMLPLYISMTKDEYNTLKTGGTGGKGGIWDKKFEGQG